MRRARQADAEDFRPGLGNQHVILNADSQFLAWNINSWLYGEDHSGLDARRGVPGVVHVQSEEMTGGVNEVPAVTCVADHLTGGPIQLREGDAGLDQGQNLL